MPAEHSELPDQRLPLQITIILIVVTLVVVGGVVDAVAVALALAVGGGDVDVDLGLGAQQGLADAPGAVGEVSADGGSAYRYGVSESVVIRLAEKSPQGSLGME